MNKLQFLKMWLMMRYSPDQILKFKKIIKVVILCLICFTICFGIGVLFVKSVSAEPLTDDTLVVDSMPDIKSAPALRAGSASFTTDNNSFISDTILDYFKGIFIKQGDFDSYFVFQHYQTSGSSSYRVYHLVMFDKLNQVGLPSRISNCCDIRLYQAYITGVGRSQYVVEQYDLSTLNISGDYITCFTNFPDVDNIPLWSDYWFMNNNLLWVRVIGVVTLMFMLLWFGMQFIKKRWYV